MKNLTTLLLASCFSTPASWAQSPGFSARILSPEDRAALQNAFDKSSPGLEAIRTLLGRSHGGGHGKIVAIKFKFRADGGKPGAAEREPTRICVTWDDGTCGCEEDPPGISYEC